ncbi:MAG: hypothetical protein ACM3ML_19885 [Micromonosporaceae bacterium]
MLGTPLEAARIAARPSTTLPPSPGGKVMAWLRRKHRLSAELTLPQLRRRWGAPRSASAEHSGAAAAQSGPSRFTAAERGAIYTHAARRATAAAEPIRDCAHRDPAAAADTAWAVADALYVAAHATGSRVLRYAADA